MKCIIAGSRTLRNYKVFRQLIDPCSLESYITEVVSGVAQGPDQMGERWATEHKIPVKRFPAEWDRFGKSAGYIRNEDMRDYADMLVALWDGESKGTSHMIRIMESKDKPVIVLYFTPSLSQVSTVYKPISNWRKFEY